MENVRIIEIPQCKMVSSQCGMFGDGKLESFNEWFSSLPRTIFPNDFLWFDNDQGGLIWYYIYNDGMNLPEAFNIIDFPGGLYAVASDIDGQDSSEVINVIKVLLRKKAVLRKILLVNTWEIFQHHPLPVRQWAIIKWIIMCR